MKNRPLKILAVDDHPDNLVSLKALIRDLFPSALTITETSASRALIVAEIEDPDVILLDIFMPEMDGFEACRQLKANPRLNEIPVVFVTAAREGKEIRIRALESGAEAFLAKPIDESELKAQISAMVRIKEAHQQKRTETQRLEALVQEKTQELQRINATLRVSDQALKAISQGVIITDPHQNILSVNKAFEAMTGYREPEVLGRRCRFLQGPLTDPFQMAAIRRAVNQNLHFHGEILNYRKDGTPFWNELTISPVYDEQSVLSHYIGITRDVTQRKADEVHQKDLLAQLYQSQKMESLGLLASGVAHDMNNVLAAISALASVQTQVQEAESRPRKAFETILKAVRRGSGMVAGLLNFSRKELAQVKTVDWNALVREQITLLEHSTLSLVTLKTDLDPTPTLIDGDEGALGNALMNLCINAVDALRDQEGDRVLLLRTRNKGDLVEVEVIDNGAGIAPEVQGRIFDPFFTTKPQGRGTGLGLSLVYSLVQAHRGQVTVESEPGRGTTMRMTFPKALQPAKEEEPAETPGAGVSHDSRRVLLVDDDELVRESLTELLETLGCSVTQVDSGERAMVHLEQGEPIDLMLLDMNMPGQGGPKTLEATRSLRPQLPVLVMTGLADQNVMSLVTATPLTRLLEKPFDLSDLRKVLSQSDGTG